MPNTSAHDLGIGQRRSIGSLLHRGKQLRIYELMRVLAAAALALSVAELVSESFNQTFIDTFYMVASGRWMLENHAVQTTGISSPIPTGFVSHNWLFCLFAAICLQASEALGLNWYGMSVMTIAMALCCVACAVVVARRETRNSRTAQIYTVLFLLASATMDDFRAHAIVVTLTIYCLWASKEYVDSGRTKQLALIPILTVLHSNIQAATVLTEAMVCLGYGATALLFPESKSRRAATPLFLVGIASLLASFVNPYGVDAVLYAWTNAGIAGYKDAVREMRGLLAFVRNDSVFYLWRVVVPALFVGLSLLGQTHAKRYFVAENAMAVAGMLAVFFAMRNALYTFLLVWWLAIVSWSEIRSYLLHLAKARTLSDVFTLGDSKAKSIVTYAAYTLTVIALLNGAFVVVEEMRATHSQAQFESGILSADAAPIAAADFIERDAAGRRPRVLAIPNFGSYLEYRGFVVNCTSRWETWEPAISGVGEHFFYDTADALYLDGDRDALDRLLSVASWDYVIVASTGGDDLVVKAIDRLDEFKPVFTEDLYDDGSLKAFVYKHV